MNNTNIIVKYAIIIGLCIIPFIPLYVADTMFFPFITGKAFAFRIIVEIVFALWLILLLREKGTSVAGTDKSVAPRVNSMSIAVTLFTLIVLIADLAGLNPLRSIWSNFERMEGWLTIAHLWAYFIILSSVFGSGEYGKKNWHNFFNIVLFSGFIVAVYGAFQFFGWAEIHQGASRVDASLGNSAYMAVFMLINAFLSAYMAITVSRTPKVWFYSILFAIFSFIMFQTATRGTILGWIAAVLISCVIYTVFGRADKGQSNKSRYISAMIVALTIILSIVFYFNRDAQWIKNNEVLGRLATISLSDTKTQARGYIWPMAVNEIFDSPKTTIIGVGQENFNYIFNANYNPEMWKHEQWFDRAHSVFLDWLVASGILGFLSYLSLYVISFLYILKSNMTVGQKSALIGLLVGYGIHNIFVFDNQTSYVMFFTFLAFIHSMKSGKIYKCFLNLEKNLSEDYITVRDYIYTPVIVIVLLSSLYFINIRPIQANRGLIELFKVCNSGGSNLTVKTFEKVFKLDQTVANQESREQILNCIGNIIRGGESIQKKTEFYQFAQKEINKQIATTPNDARIYIIGGSFYNSIGDWKTATPLLEKAMELSPNKQSIVFEVALNYLNIGKKKEALDILEKTYLLAKDNDTAKIAYIMALVSNNQDTKAKELFGDDTEIFSDERIINAYIVSKQYSKAIDIYKRLLKNDSDNQEIYSSLASIYLMDKQKGLAIQTLNTAKDKFPLLKDQINEVIKQIQEGKI